MIEIKEDSQQRGGDQHSDSPLVDLDTTITTIATARLSKSFQSKDGKISRRSTVSSRTITRSNKSSSADIHALNLTGMDSTTVVSPRRGSSPRINSFIAHLDTHGVFSFDALDSLPTYSNLIEWISNSDSLIKEFDLGSMQNQVNQSYREGSPANTEKSSVPRTSKKTLRDQNQNHQINDQRSEDAASWSKNLDIVHEAILSQKNEATHV